MARQQQQTHLRTPRMARQQQQTHLRTPRTHTPIRGRQQVLVLNGVWPTCRTGFVRWNVPSASLFPRRATCHITYAHRHSHLACITVGALGWVPLNISWPLLSRAHGFILPSRQLCPRPHHSICGMDLVMLPLCSWARPRHATTCVDHTHTQTHTHTH
jgi:hypothetical protein